MRYRLETPHYISEAYRWCDRGTEIGDGTEVPYHGIPSQFMTPLDDEAKAAVKKMEDWRESRASYAPVAEGQKALLEAAAAAVPEVMRMTGQTAVKDKPGNLPGQLPKGA